MDFNGTKYGYVQNLQGDIIQIIDANGAVVVEYTYDAWGKVLNVTGSMAGTLGEIQPFRYRGYVYDVETGLYYLRSRYYNPAFGRFSNLDAEINKNLYCYCSNSPILFKDTNGLSKELSTDNICNFNGDDWGTNVSKLPVSVLVSVTIQIYDEGDWEYRKGPVEYKKIDCIGLILLVAKFHFTKAAFGKNGYNIGLGTTSAATNNRSFPLRKTSSTDISNLRVGTILYCPSLTGAARGHVGIYIGYYDDGNGHIIKHAVIHCHGKESKDDEAGVSIVAFEGSRFDCAQGEYTEYNYLDYDMSYDDTVQKYRGL